MPAIEDYYFLLSDRLETYPDAKNKIKIWSQLEALGYSGDSVFQRILGDLYAGGVIIEANEKRAVSGIRKPRHKMMRSQQIILPNTILV